MDAQQEQQVLSTVYDRLMDAITYSPGGHATGAVGDRPLLQMAKNFVINPADMANAFSPVNPNGSFATAEAYSTMVDALPQDASTSWSDSGLRLSTTYRDLVNGANTNSQISPSQQAIYDKAMAFLTQSQTITSFDGTKTTTQVPTPIANAYDNNQAAYIAAVTGYRTAYLGYDLTQTADQRAWNAVAPGLQNLVDRTWNTWNQQGKAQVEQARAALASTINDAVRNAIQAAQTAVAPGAWFASTTGGPSWLPTYGQPSNWADPSSTASHLTLRSSYLNQTASSNASSYSAGANGMYGLWTFGGSASHSSVESQQHMDANEFQLDAELILVRIMRPWYNPLLFAMNGWWVDGLSKGAISNVPGTLPHVPTALVVARNVTITADFSSEDQTHFESQTEAGVSVGWGPFAVSGTYANSKTNDTFTSTYNGGALKLPGLQVIGVVCSTTPSPCPPLDPPDGAGASPATSGASGG